MEVQAFVTRNPNGFVLTSPMCRYKHIKREMLFLHNPNTNTELAKHGEQRGTEDQHETNQRKLQQLEVDLIQTLKNSHKSQSIADVYQILQEGSARFSPIYKPRNQKNGMKKKRIYEFLPIQNIPPNLAAIALRKVVDCSIKSKEKQKDSEEQMFIHTIRSLLEVLSCFYIYDKTTYGKLAKERTNAEPSRLHCLNAYGKSDFIHAIAKLSKTSPSLQEKTLDSQKDLLLLIQKIFIFDSREEEEKFFKTLGPHRLAELFFSMTSLLIYFQRTSEPNIRNFLPFFSHFFRTIVTHFQYGHVLAQLTFREMTQILENYVTILEYGAFSSPEQHALPPPPGFIMSIMRRLRKQKVRLALFQNKDHYHPTGGFLLSRAMWSSAKIVEQLEFLDAIGEFPTTFRTTSQDFTGCSNKDAKLNENYTTSETESIWEMARMREEAKILCYTLLRALLQKFPSECGIQTKDEGIENTDTLPSFSSKKISQTLLHSTSAKNVADILWACVTLEFSGEEDILLNFSDLLTHESMILQHKPYILHNNDSTIDLRICKNNIGVIAHLLWAHQRLRWNKNINSIKLLAAGFQYNVQQYLQIQKHRQESVNQINGIICLDSGEICDPKAVVTVLRSAVLLCPGYNDVTKEIFAAASELILSDNENSSFKNEDSIDKKLPQSSLPPTEDQSIGLFLASCNEFEVSNIAWSLAKAHWTNPKVFSRIEKRMLQKDILETCSPSSASRFLWSYATISSLRHKALSYEMEDVAATDNINNANTVSDTYKGTEFELQVFHKISPILLSAQLTPVDASAAMWAMGKISYNLDLGIFDHLAEVLAGDFMLNRASSKHLSQALWACGRMVAWEEYPHLQDKKRKYSNDSSDIVINREDLKRPPYWKCAEKFAASLAEGVEGMNEKDLAQSIWALGRLKIENAEIVNVLVNGTLDKISDSRVSFNSQEISNILWGLSKVGYENKENISVLLDYLTSSHVLQQCTSQEAANVLLALARMQIPEDMVFLKMSNVMMNRLSEATPQGIANALWAHQTMGLDPPQELFDCWANKKLGLLGLSTILSNNATIQSIQET